MNAIQGRIGLALLAALALLPALGCGGSSNKTPRPDNRSSVSIVLNSIGGTVDQGGTRQFSATVYGGANTAVSWSVQEGITGGSINAQGLYTAPFAAGNYHIIATSSQDPTKSASTEIIVPSINISITPSQGEMEPGENQQFEALVTGTVNHAVDWSVSENSIGGFVTNSGLYTAPAIVGKYHVVATSAYDKSSSGVAEVFVSAVSVSIVPRALGLVPGGTWQFTASVAGTMDDNVLWSVQEGATGGTITENGLYTGPTQTGDYHVVASSVSHPGVTGTALVSIAKSHFKATGKMLNPRSFHTATLLPDGNVLVVGGSRNDVWESHTSAELYDPSSGAFKATGSMAAGRDGHTATLLANGKVLITGGGITDWISIGSAEIYDPATGTFTPTADMSARRSNHTATRLQNGKVLIIGGIDWTEFSPEEQLKRAELYDPDTGTFSSAGTLKEHISNHTATLLDDGRVLVTGGGVGYYGETSRTVLIYDPQTAVFSEVQSMDIARQSHSATLLPDNRVLITGGFYYTPADPFTQTFIDDAGILSIATSQFSPPIEMNQPRSRHTATLLSNKTVLIAGGTTGILEMWWYAPDSSAEIFDPAMSKFVITGPMTTSRIGHTATLLPNGEVLIAGGSDDSSAELYVP